jgi:hypothetical protein
MAKDAPAAGDRKNSSYPFGYETSGCCSLLCQFSAWLPLFHGLNTRTAKLRWQMQSIARDKGPYCTNAAVWNRIILLSVLIVARQFLVEAECVWDIGALQFRTIRFIEMHIDGGKCIGEVICLGSAYNRRSESGLLDEPR